MYLVIDEQRLNILTVSVLLRFLELIAAKCNTANPC